MKKGIFIAWVFFMAACSSPEPEQTNPAGATNVLAADSAQLSLKLASGLLDQYLQMKALFPNVQDTVRLHALAEQMIYRADSLVAAATQLPQPLNDSVASISISLSDELNGLRAETDAHEINMAFQLTGMELFQLLKWVNYQRVPVYKMYDANCLFGRGGEWLDITRNSLHPFSSEPGKPQYQINDSIQAR
jgi:hypothetical protein